VNPRIIIIDVHWNVFGDFTFVKENHTSRIRNIRKATACDGSFSPWRICAMSPRGKSDWRFNISTRQSDTIWKWVQTLVVVILQCVMNATRKPIVTLAFLAITLPALVNTSMEHFSRVTPFLEWIKSKLKSKFSRLVQQIFVDH
jgi:hypothetical protein